MGVGTIWAQLAAGNVLAGAAMILYMICFVNWNKAVIQAQSRIKHTMKEYKNSMIERIKSDAKQYVDWEPNDIFRNQVSDALSSNNIPLLQSMFTKRISFGTAGLRSKMYGGYAYMNDLVIIQTCQGLTKYIESQHQDKEKYQEAKNQGVIIGYDARHNSDRFAKIALSIFLSNGYKIYWFNRFAATPFIPYGILKLKCCLGIVITASHNPKLDNGFKVYWNNGSQIIPPHDGGIVNQYQITLSHGYKY